MSRSNQPSTILLRARSARALRVLSALRGWKTLVNWVVPNHGGSFTVRNSSLTFEGNIGSFIDRQVYLFGGYESEIIRCFLASIPIGRRGVILDIGANIGTHSLTFARAFELVVAFEPNPNLWAQFEKNVALNNLKNVRLQKVGLADQDTNMTLHLIDKPNYGLGTFSKIEQYDLPLRPEATCSVRQGDRYLKEIGIEHVDAVKIDVQGFEPEVLRGLAVTLKRSKPMIWCEIGAGTLAQITTVKDLQSLVPFKFRCWRFSQSKGMSISVVLRETIEALPAGDYLLIPVEEA